MSVTTPIFRFAWAAADADADAEAASDGDAAADGDVAGADGAAADGLGLAPPPHAATMMARPPNSDRPSERLCMCPPPASRSARPRLVGWSVVVSRNVRSAERPSAHPSDGGSAGQVRLTA